MSHSVKVTLIADQLISIKGKLVNIHNIRSIVLDSKGTAIDAYTKDNEWLSNMFQISAQDNPAH